MRSLTELLTQIQQAWPTTAGSISAVEELTIEVTADDWHAMALFLRDKLGFEQLMDLCGVDYSTYGQVNWATDTAVNAGFSRGVFDFETQSETVATTMVEKRFAGGVFKFNFHFCNFFTIHFLTSLHSLINVCALRYFVMIRNSQWLTVYAMFGRQ